jgi:hypothetical protein
VAKTSVCFKDRVSLNGVQLGPLSAERDRRISHSPELRVATNDQRRAISARLQRGKRARGAPPDARFLHGKVNTNGAIGHAPPSAAISGSAAKKAALALHALASTLALSATPICLMVTRYADGRHSLRRHCACRTAHSTPLARTPDASTIQALPESHSDFPLEVRVDSWRVVVVLGLLVAIVAIAAFVKRRRAR